MNVVYRNTKSIQKFIHEISTIDFSKYIVENKKINKLEKYDKSIVTADEIDDMFLENTLIVSWWNWWYVFREYFNSFWYTEKSYFTI